MFCKIRDCIATDKTAEVVCFGDKIFALSAICVWLFFKGKEVATILTRIMLVNVRGNIARARVIIGRFIINVPIFEGGLSCAEN
jgi:hypothetical protein